MRPTENFLKYAVTSDTSALSQTQNPLYEEEILTTFMASVAAATDGTHDVSPTESLTAQQCIHHHDYRITLEENPLGRGAQGIVYPGTLTFSKERQTTTLRIAAKCIFAGDAMPPTEFTMHSDLSQDSEANSAILRAITTTRLRDPATQEEKTFQIYALCDLVLSERTPYICNTLKAQDPIIHLHLVSRFLQDMTLALRKLRNGPRPIQHLDLKPANILRRKGWKVSDLGCAVHDDEIHTISVVRGTPGYIAPEMAAFDKAALIAFPGQADLWSIGRIIEEMRGDNSRYVFENTTVPAEIFSFREREIYIEKRGQNVAKIPSVSIIEQINHPTVDAHKALIIINQAMCKTLPEERINLTQLEAAVRILIAKLPTLTSEQEAILKTALSSQYEFQSNQGQENREISTVSFDCFEDSLAKTEDTLSSTDNESDNPQTDTPVITIQSSQRLFRKPLTSTENVVKAAQASAALVMSS